jgi:potassium-transporting ATPase KdpC subunit
MDSTIERTCFITKAGASIRIVFVTMLVCCFLYPLVILGLGQTLSPNSANGSLVSNGRGEIIGSTLLSQKFDRCEYFWPRPSAVDYNASAAGGSNLSPTNPALRDRANALLMRFGTQSVKPIPADLVTASGSGLDPDITVDAANYQAERVAASRGLPIETVMKLLDQQAYRPGGMLTPYRLVNVLLLNMELDKLGR